MAVPYHAEKVSTIHLSKQVFPFHFLLIADN
ncbi:hypothetical protein BH10CHL1_BH10CHL1_00660 [soil metagenome]